MNIGRKIFDRAGFCKMDIRPDFFLQSRLISESCGAMDIS